MNPAYFSYSTMLFYYFIAIAVTLIVKMAKGNNKIPTFQENTAYFMLFIILVLFAVLRKVSYHIGGTDALNYQQYFLSCLNTSSRFEDVDLAFGYFTKLIRSLTNSPVAYRFICYSIIAGSYVYFIKYLCPKGISSIPFLILIWPYIKSFNTMRSSLAIAIFLISLVLLYRDKKMLAWMFILMTPFIHRMSVIYVPIILFIWLFGKKLLSLNGKKLFIYLIVYVVVGYFAARFIQSYIISSSLLKDSSSADSYYIQMSMGKSIFANWPMLLPHVLLLLGLVIFNYKLPRTKQINFIKTLFIYDIIIYPPAIIFGMWRASEYLYLASIILWGILIPVICRNLDQTGKTLVRVTFIVAFIFIIYIRFTHEWNECKIMPYLPIWC